MESSLHCDMFTNANLTLTSDLVDHAFSQGTLKIQDLYIWCCFAFYVKKRCVCETLCPHWQQSLKKLLLAHRSKSRSQVIDDGVIPKGIISGECMPNIKSYISYGSKIIAKVKVGNKQSNRQDKNNLPPIYWFGGRKRIQISVSIWSRYLKINWNDSFY